jgi:hypothetical protein
MDPLDTRKQIDAIESKLLQEEKYDVESLRNNQTISSHNDKESSQRFLQYSLTDARFEDDYMKFCTEVKPLSTEERKRLFQFISRYTEDDLSEELLESMPCFQRFLLGPLPCKYAPIIGAAGTGKTTATANMIIRNNTITVCGATNPAFAAFMTQLQQNVKPAAYSKLTKETLHKLVNIRFEEPFVQTLLKSLNLNKDLNDSYIKLVNSTTLLSNRTKAQKCIYEHVKTVLRVLHPLLCFSINKLKRSFRNNQKQFRLEITDIQHPYFQADDEKFSFIKQAESRKTSRSWNSVKTFDGYQSLVLSQCNSKSYYNSSLPNIMILANTFIIDEAGRVEAYFNILISFIWWFLQFTYNTPMLYETIPIISPSGSDSQSNVINFPVSMIDEAICPAVIWDAESVLVYRSEHNRRKINAFSDLKSSMHNATCLSLENFKEDEFTYKTFMFNETFPELVMDPRIKPKAIRMFPYHRDCEQFLENMSSHGTNNFEICDNVFITSDLTLINHNNFNTNECDNDNDNDDHDDDNEDEISVLSESEARRNRLHMWKQKKDIYSDGYIARDEVYKEKYTCKEPMLNDVGFNEKVEEVLQEMYMNIQEQKKQVCHDEREIRKKYGQIMTEEEIENIEYGELMWKELNEKYVSEDDNSNRHDIRFICGPAKLMLSHKEHKLKRMHAKGIANELGDAFQLSKHYYSSTVALGQTTKMQYIPKYDLCLEIADPNYTGDDKLLQKSLDRTVNTRSVYMCISRKRCFPYLYPVVSGTYNTSIILRGVSGIVKDIIYAECFTSSDTAFRLLVYCGLLEEYRKWVYSLQCKTNNIDVFSMERDHIVQLSNTLNVPSVEKKIIESYEHVISASCNRHCNDFKYIDLKTTNKSRLLLNVEQLQDALKRLIMNALDVSQDFARKHIEFFIENCELLTTWKFLLYRAIKPFSLDKAEYTSKGDLIVLGTGNHQCNINTMRRENKHMYNKYNLEWEKVHIGKKNLHSIMHNTIYNTFPDLIAATSLTLLLKGLIIANTHPSVMHKHLNLFDVLVPCKNKNFQHKQSQYGLMMRSAAANFQQKANSLIHKIYTVNGGESMNFPRPFKIGGTNKPSNIILKCKDNVFYFSSLLNDDIKKISRKKVETFSIFPLMNPLFLDGPYTIDSMQGKTTNGECVVDLHNVDRSKHLVAVTRNNSSHNLLTSNVSAAMKRKNVLSPFIPMKTHNKRLTAKYFKYR